MKAAFLAVVLLAGSAHARIGRAGILLLAHGGDEKWNAEVERLRVEVDSRTPTELALGMADPKAMQEAVDRLSARGVTRITAVPLFVNSHSEVMDQTRYALGHAGKPSEVLRAAAERMKSMPMPPGMPHHHMHMFSLERVKHEAPLVIAPALDDDVFVSVILAERAQALSKDAAAETVILVAHGPVDDAAVQYWEKDMAAHAAYVAKSRPFRAAKIALLRDDAAPDVRALAVAKLRALVAEAGKNGGRALVVPVLIARGGIEDKIPRDLAGLTFAWSGDALLPHAGLDVWILRKGTEGWGVPP